MNIKTQKAVLRKMMLEHRNKLSLKEREKMSKEICTQLWSYILAKEIKTIHSYLPMRSEVDVLPLLQKALSTGLTVIAPKTLRKRQLQHLVLKDLNELEEGIFNTHHPKNANIYTASYDLILVAGLAFDKTGYRLGYGGGYYDTFLAEHPSAKKIGVCYPFQIVESVPTEEHDLRLDLVIH